MSTQHAMSAQYRYRVLIRMEIAPDRTEEFELAWLDIAAAAREHPANLDQWLGRDHENDHVYHIVTDWIDEAGFRDFERSPAHATNGARLRGLRTGGSRTSMSLLVHLGGGHATPTREPAR